MRIHFLLSSFLSISAPNALGRPPSLCPSVYLSYKYTQYIKQHIILDYKVNRLVEINLHCYQATKEALCYVRARSKYSEHKLLLCYTILRNGSWLKSVVQLYDGYQGNPCQLKHYSLEKYKSKKVKLLIY